MELELLKMDLATVKNPHYEVKNNFFMSFSWSQRQELYGQEMEPENSFAPGSQPGKNLPAQQDLAYL